jgi:hypothetical protein
VWGRSWSPLAISINPVKSLAIPKSSSRKVPGAVGFAQFVDEFHIPLPGSINYTAYDGESVVISVACGGVYGAPVKLAMMHKTQPANV